MSYLEWEQDPKLSNVYFKKRRSNELQGVFFVLLCGDPAFPLNRS